MGGSLNEKTLWQKKKTMRFEEDFGKFPSLFFFGSRFFFGWGVGVSFWEDFGGKLTSRFGLSILFFGQFSVKKPTWAIYTTFWPKGFRNFRGPDRLAVLG